MSFFAHKRSDEKATPETPGRRPQVTFARVGADGEGQRLDNWLLKFTKGVPKSHLYRIVRSGEVRVNGARCSADTRLAEGDTVRLPPMRTAAPQERRAPAIDSDQLPVLFEDRDLLIVNKPAGLAAHGGSGVAFGLIERLRATRPEAAFLELAHRLDRATSGLLVVCKTRKALVRLQEAQRSGGVRKHYRLIVAGDWVNEHQHVRLPLHKYVLPNGERRARVDEAEGQKCHTVFSVLRRFGPVTYLDAELKTGRTHQIRVHAQACGFPILGDEKYGLEDVNRAAARGSLGVPFRRMALHAWRLDFAHPVTGEPLTVVAPLPGEFEQLMGTLQASGDH